MKLYTIGHSNHRIEQLIQLLNDQGIMILVDVRTAPYSRFNPQFNKENLERELLLQNIQYAYAGRYLGGRPSDPACYKSGVLPSTDTDYLHEVDYLEVMKRSWFIQGIGQLLELADQDLAAVMCSEENPADCHRHHLIAKYLLDKNPEVDVWHIRGDGTVFRASTLSTSVNEIKSEQLPLF